jgi:hypothetical protein
MENYLVRIQKFIEAQGLKNTEVEGIMDVSVGVIRKNIKEGSQLNGKALENFLLHYKQANPEWIMTGRGEMINTPSPIAIDPALIEELEEENERLLIELNAIKIKASKLKDRLFNMQTNLVATLQELNTLKKAK